METYDDDLSRFEADGAAPLPVTHDQGYVEHDGALIWYVTYGSGPPVILLHGGLGHSGNWGYQVLNRTTGHSYTQAASCEHSSCELLAVASACTAAVTSGV